MAGKVVIKPSGSQEEKQKKAAWSKAGSDINFVGLPENALWKHCANVHGEEIQDFSMTVVDRCRSDPMKRQILEAIRIQKVPQERSMNSRSEWNTARIPRVQIVTDVIA